jgi:hypothetical protein
MKSQSKARISLPTFSKIVTQEQRIAVGAAATADNDNMNFPTHAVMRDGEIIGGFCLAGVPMVMGWMHTEKSTGKDSYHIQGVVDSIMNDRGAATYMLACNNNSPFIDHMGSMGFNPVWPTNIFHKRTS